MERLRSVEGRKRGGYLGGVSFLNSIGAWGGMFGLAFSKCFQAGPTETPIIKTRGGQEQHYNEYKHCRNIQKTKMETTHSKAGVWIWGST